MRFAWYRASTGCLLLVSKPAGENTASDGDVKRGLMASAESHLAALRGQGRIPLWVKILYTGFVSVLVPYYWHDYGPTNHAWTSDGRL